MKIQFIKQPGGVLVPASDIEAEKLTKFKTGGMYEVEIKNSRNYVFHQKVFVFFNFCFEHWRGDREFLSPSEQFNVFRSHLTCLAGYKNVLVNIAGEVRVEAQSISYASMDQEKFENFYHALVNAAIEHIFYDADESIENKLLSFF